MTAMKAEMQTQFDESLAEKDIGKAATSEYISDVHRSISPAGYLSRLRDIFNEALEISIGERKEWLVRNVADPEERQAVTTLLLAYDSDGFIEADAD